MKVEFPIRWQRKKMIAVSAGFINNLNKFIVPRKHVIDWHRVKVFSFLVYSTFVPIGSIVHVITRSPERTAPDYFIIYLYSLFCFGLYFLCVCWSYGNQATASSSCCRAVRKFVSLIHFPTPFECVTRFCPCNGYEY